MKHMRRLICMALMIATVLSLSVSAFAAEYTFESTSDSEYYPSTSYTMAVLFNCIAENESDLMIDPYLNAICATA